MIKIRFLRYAALALMAVPSSGTTGVPIAPVQPGASATKARDIQGFVLGSSIREAAKRFSPTYAQGDQIQGKLGDIELTFEFCPSGAIYFVQSTQTLGHFEVDKKFLDNLRAKLSAKYGPGYGAPDNLSWGLTEPVRYTTGEVRNFTTNWMSALLSEDSGDGVSLELKMLDFRICWAEREKENEKPRNAASQALKI